MAYLTPSQFVYNIKIIKYGKVHSVLLFFICVFLSSNTRGIYCSDILKDLAGSWEEPWKHVVEDVGNTDEHLNKLPQDHPYVIETIEDNFILKPYLDRVQMNKNMWTKVDNPVSASRVSWRNEVAVSIACSRAKTKTKTKPSSKVFFCSR